MLHDQQLDHLLSDDLWAQVFLVLEQEFFTEAAAAATDPEIVVSPPVAEKYSQFHSLRLVCNRFNRVFKHRPKLSSCLILHDHFSHRSLLSLLLWLRREESHVEMFIADCSNPCAEAALAATLTATACLTDGVSGVALRRASPCSISVLSNFSSLTSCVLRGPTDEQLDLAPLQVLSHLQQLQMHHGSFANVGLLAELNHVVVSNSDVQYGQNCLSSSRLQKLELFDSTLKELSLADCSSLHELTCWSSNILEAAASQDVAIPDTLQAFCLGLSGLTQLTYLDFLADCAHEGNCDISWVYTLTGLQRLRLYFKEGCVKVTEELTLLTDLTDLMIKCGHYSEAVPVLTLDVPWKHLRDLQEVTFFSATLQVGLDILDLICLRHLKYVDFDEAKVLDEFSAGCLGALMYNMAIRRGKLQPKSQ